MKNRSFPYRAARLWMFGLLAGSLVLAGCQTGPADRDRAADEALARQKPSKIPAPPSAEPRPEFKQEPPSSR